MAIFEKYQDDLTAGKKVVLGVQHAFTMFGATILVPILTGLDISVALFMAGIGTLFFHLVTSGKVPVFLGSSFAFIAPIAAVGGIYGLPYAQGGIVIAGLVYLILALLVYIFGPDRIISFFPPVVTGPIIIIIGLTLAPVAIGGASENWLLAFASFAIVAAVAVFTRGFIQVLPVLCGLVGGYLIAFFTGNVDFTPVINADWIGIPAFTVAKFNLNAIMIVAPVAIVTMIEHIGDVIAISATCNKDFIKSPGLPRTLLGDGIATSISAMLGGPANTTYSENTGVLALTRQYNPVVMRIAACFAILLGVIPKLSAIIATIPGAVIGGISIVLFGMIAAVGARTLVENRVDFKKSRNLLIAAVVLVLGLGGAELPINVGSFSITISSLALAAIVGIILNKALPEKMKRFG
ncbi:MAG: uracil-xanthine permease family protein [Treponema sp.]|nr:uracil-xanthine permease family protein [Treponema sp.]